MSRVAVQGLVMVGGFIALLVVASLVFVRLDGNAARGAAIGAGLGLLNLGLGLVMARKSMRNARERGSSAASAMATLLGGFFVRMVVLVVLIEIFMRTSTIDPAAFGLTFLVFFFVYLGFELVMVERARSTRGAPSVNVNGGTA
ncbi:MAG TPA: ATP synthase subunit I [Actinomycetota bacterium]|nr:ATP synthase subunit I [Actinomycetota bacterium]